MKLILHYPGKAVLLAAFFLMSLRSTAQCNWTTYFYDNFEYNTVIPYIVPGTTYQNTPQTYAAHSGSLGLYLNFVDGVSGMVYNQPFNNLCVGASYRFSIWARDAFTSSNNMTFKVLDANGVVISTQTVVTNSVWQLVTIPAFVANTSTISFQIVTNIPGGPGNDAGLDELTLSVCSPPVSNYSLTQCSSAGNADLYNQITSGLSSNGSWSGPTTLQNGYHGTFVPGTNTNGIYTYTVDAGGTCPDSVATVNVNITSAPNINPLGPIVSCGSYTLPAITGTGLTGNQHYYTGSGGTGTMITTGSVITSSQTVYMYDGITGCSDNEPVSITIASGGNAGNDNSSSFCGPGPVVNMNNYLSAGASSGGTWAETTSPPSGTFNTSTAVWTTASLGAGTYTFTYTIPANGSCPADVANFSLTLGNVPSVHLGNDTTLCPGHTITLNAGSGYSSYLWNNGATNQTKYVSNPGGTYWVKVGTVGANIVVNGDFESGNTGFTTQYTLGTGGTWGALSNEGTYAITTSPNLVHSNFNSCTDHTAAPGVNQLVVNGSSVANTQVWCQTVPVSPNTTYQFGTWVTSALTDPSVAQLQFMINGVQLGPIFSPSMNGCSWSQFTQTWQSMSVSSAQLCILNQNVSPSGNDFAIDDITFKPVCYSTDTIVVSYSTNPVVNLGPDQNVCETSLVTLDAQNPGMNYLWNTGETTQTLNVTTSGTHSVTVTNQYGCSGTDNVVVNVEALQNSGADSSDFICSTDLNYSLSTLLSSSASTGGTWESLSSSFDGTLAANGDLSLTGSAGTFDFQYVVHGTYCPNDTSAQQLIVHQQPVAAPDQSLHYCNTTGTSVDFTGYLNHPFEPITGYWTESANVPAGNFDPTTNIFDLTNVPHDNYVFDYVLPAEPGCVQDTTEIKLKVTAVPVVSFTSDVTEGCQPLEVNFTNTSTVQGNTVYNWDLGDGTGSSSNSLVNIIYEAANCYDITLTVTSDGICTSTLTQNNMICVHEVPVAAFDYGPQQVFSDGPTVQFNNQSTPHLYSAWSFGDGGTSSAENPEHEFPLGEIGNYTVELTVTTDFGCSDTVTHIIVVKDQLLYYVPNTFTPDSDENNPVFRPVLTAGMDKDDYHLEIFNRWGELVFETYDINEGWDGTYNGEEAKEGAYSWKLSFGLEDSDGKETAVGHVNLLK